MKRTLLLTLLLLSLAAGGMRAQTGKHFDADKQMSSSFTTQVYQDRDGFMWVATRNGLNRYDGYQFQILKKEQKENLGMASNYVNCLLQNRHGLFYIGMYGALQTYDGERFTDITTRDLEGRVVPCYITCLLERTNGEILIGTSGHGMLQITDKTSAQEMGGALEGLFGVHRILEDRWGRLWIVTESQGLWLYDESADRVQRFLDKEDERSTLTDICEDSEGRIYVATTGRGLLQMEGSHIVPIAGTEGKAISAGVYPAWHPAAKLVTFSTNLTHQVFHTAHPNKVEVFDTASDLILYDVVKDSVSIISNDPDLLEVFPSWSPDGKYLYYCKSVPLPEEMRDKDIRTTYPKVQYNLYRRSFEISSQSFGEEELVYDAASADKSVTLPRISSDGHYLLFAEGRYGCFHIWHHDADIVCIPMDQYTGDALTAETSSPIDLTLFNSEGHSDSYPTWSSNGHWIMCASRRDDDNFSRVYFAYFNNGKVEKAFLLPQEDPEMHVTLLKSYNRPEFMVEPVKISVNEFSRAF